MADTRALQPDFRRLFESLPGLYLVLAPDAPRYTIVAVSDAYSRATRTKREDIVGHGLFEVLPDDRSDPKKWSPTNSPVFGANGELAYIIRRVDDPTDVERANRELRVANEHLEQLVEFAPDGIFIADLTGRFTSVNSAACRMLGYSREELLEKHVLDLVPAREVSRMMEHRERLLAGIVETAEWTGVRSDGSEFPSEVSARILPDGRWQAIVRDISARKRLEAALAFSLEHLNHAQSVGKIGGWRLDARGELHWSDEEYRIFGIPIGTPMRYERFLACVHPDDRGYVDREWQAALGGAPHDIEHRIIVAGEIKWVRERADLEFDAHGALLSVIGITQDITQRKELESRLQSLNADLNRAQAVAKIGSWRLDIHHNVLEWSEEIYRIFGVPQSTPMTYEAFLACVHPDDRAYVDGAWKAALREVPYDIEHRLLVAGEIKWVREKAELKFDEHGALLGGVGITQDITERKLHEEEQRRVQEQIRESQERFDLALKGGGLATWDWNVTTGEVVLNPRWAEMRGLSPHEVRPHVSSWSAGIHPDDLPRVQQALNDHFSGRTAEYRIEYRVQKPAGGWVWIVDLGRVFARDKTGQPLRMVGVELDITERKRLEEDLRIAEAKSSGIVSISADAIISVDENQRITLFNEGAERIFGYRAEEALGAPLGTLVPERVRAMHQQHVARFAASPDVSRPMGHGGLEIVGLRRNGEEFFADGALSKLEIDGRKVMTVAMRDITAQKRVEREQRLLAEMGTVFASTLDYEQTLTNIARLAVRELADVCIVDEIDGGKVRRLKVVSRDPRQEPACEALRAIPLDRARPHLTRKVLETRRSVLFERISAEQLESMSQSDEHLRLLRAIGPQSLISVPLIVRGHMLGAMTFISTTSSRLYGPAERRLIEEVGRRAALAIENARLYLAAVRALRARDEVLGVVAHDLRNPLGTVLMQATSLQRGQAASDSVRGSAERIHRAATRMNRLIQDLLDVARMEAGRLGIDRRATPTRAVVSEAVESQAARASEARVHLVPTTDDVPEVFADRERLLQVFENLIGNALKFTPAGGTVSVGATPRNGDAVVFWVADTGSGIAAGERPHVFDRFWQARSDGRGGAGLGLAIVKGIVEEHGGRVWVESVVGRGTTFFFTIPTMATAAPRRTSVRPDARGERHSRPSAPA